MTILGIETSCDETSAAILSGKSVLSNIISSQTVHLKFGGVVPELASRAHLRKIQPIVAEALEKAGGLTLDDMDAFAVTCGPGLIGALLVGLNFVKGLAQVTGKPFIGVHHIEGHVYSNFLGESSLKPPILCLLVSGGHTQLLAMDDHLQYRLLGTTLDDAVGEAYDKVGKLLGLPYPAGPVIDKLAQKGNPDYTKFPVALLRQKNFNFSYSGLKTAVLTFANRLSDQEKADRLPDICASFQKAAVAALVHKTLSAARSLHYQQIAVAGGVAANSHLREMMKQEAQKYHIKVYFPELQYCTDNAAMIARAGLQRLQSGYQSQLNANAFPSMPLDQFAKTANAND